MRRYSSCSNSFKYHKCVHHTQIIHYWSSCVRRHPILEFLRIYADLFSFWLSLLILEFLRMYAEKLRVTITVLRIYAHWRVLEFLRICADTPAAWIVLNTTNVSTIRRSSNTGVSATVRRHSESGWNITWDDPEIYLVKPWGKQDNRPDSSVCRYSMLLLPHNILVEPMAKAKSEIKKKKKKKMVRQWDAFVC